LKDPNQKKKVKRTVNGKSARINDLHSLSIQETNLDERDLIADRESLDKIDKVSPGEVLGIKDLKDDGEVEVGGVVTGSGAIHNSRKNLPPISAADSGSLFFANGLNSNSTNYDCLPKVHSSHHIRIRRAKMINTYTDTFNHQKS